MMPHIAGIPTLYCNGFAVTGTNSDVGVLIMVDNQPLVTLHLSFTTAKTLSLGLRQSIENLETITKREIMTSLDIAEAITRQNSSGDQSST